MIEFMKKGIQRTSIELSEANYELVHLYASLANGKLTYVLNYIIKMMVNIPDEVRNNLIDFCRERLIEAQENSYTFDERVKARIDAYKRLLKFLEGATTKKDVVLSGDVAKAKSVITFDLSNFRVASREAKKLGTTFSRYLNYLISLTLGIPALVQGELSVFCAQKSASVDEQNSLYWMYRERNIQESYKELAIFWAQKDPYTKEKNILLKRTDMKDGYIVYTVFRVYRENRVNRKNQLYRKYKRAKVALCGEERNIMTEIIYAKPQYKQSRMPGKELCWRVPEDMPLKNEKWALVPCKEHLYLVEILRKEWVEDNIAEQYRRVYAIGSTREELKPPIGRVHLIDADRIDMPGEVSYHAVENSKLSKPDVMELLQYPIGVTLEAGGRYRVFLGAYRFWYLRECLHWTKIPCYVYKIKRQIRDPRERRRREIHRRQQAAESPRIRLQLYENYYKLLKGMKDAGEIKGGLQMRLMQLLGISERTVRIYKQLSEQLTGREKQRLMRGKLPFVQARAIAAERNQKAAMLPDFEKAENNKDKNLPANSGE